jgi:hypothetical protein
MNQRPKEIFIKSLLTSLFQREELPLFGKEGRGEIFRQLFPFNYGLLSNFSKIRIDFETNFSHVIASPRRGVAIPLVSMHDEIASVASLPRNDIATQSPKGEKNSFLKFPSLC